MQKGFYVANSGKRHRGHYLPTGTESESSFDDLCYDLTYENDHDGMINYLNFLDNSEFRDILIESRGSFCLFVLDFIDNNEQVMPTKQEYHNLVKNWQTEVEKIIRESIRNKDDIGKTKKRLLSLPTTK